ncbi:hypothetical protein VdG1_02148 [Verticillium dahliae VDG1]|nr:hypothetical protein VdG1_02148 [Verticillium dahliae VDG1]
METKSEEKDVPMTNLPPAAPAGADDNEPVYGGFTRFEIELEPPYLKYLMYPGPTLKHLELLQQPQFRQDIISPDLVQRLVDDGMRAAVEWHHDDK